MEGVCVRGEDVGGEGVGKCERVCERVYERVYERMYEWVWVWEVSVGGKCRRVCEGVGVGMEVGVGGDSIKTQAAR